MPAYRAQGVIAAHRPRVRTLADCTATSDLAGSSRCPSDIMQFDHAVYTAASQGFEYRTGCRQGHLGSGRCQRLRTIVANWPGRSRGS